MCTGKDRVEVLAVNQPVSIGTAHVVFWGIVVADANGVVVVPRARAGEAAEVAHGIEAAESRIQDLIAQGQMLGAARAQLGYHRLQTGNE
jgi:regulator of RNase E activity RraA